MVWHSHIQAMTPDTLPKQPSPDELEAEAKIYDDHGNVLWANQLRALAQELREKHDGREIW